MSDYDNLIIKKSREIKKQDTPVRAERYNKDKPRPSLLPVEWFEELLSVMEVGAKKYGPDNWKKGMPYREVLDSLDRHLIQFKKKENIDPDDGLRTITKVAVNALFLTYYQLRQVGDDDR
jgi:hypothetical protein